MHWFQLQYGQHFLKIKRKPKKKKIKLIRKGTTQGKRIIKLHFDGTKGQYRVTGANQSDLNPTEMENPQCVLAKGMENEDLE